LVKPPGATETFVRFATYSRFLRGVSHAQTGALVTVARGFAAIA
jgi:hypothetical protein